MEEKSYKEYLEHITTFVFDVDGVLTDGTVSVLTNGEMLRTMNVKDGYAIRSAVDKGYNLCIISGGKNEGVRIRLEGLGIKDIYLGAKNKIEQLDDYLTANDIKSENVLYMGDDIPDYEIMAAIGLPTCPNDAATEIKQISQYISPLGGGKGAVRDVIEKVMRSQGKWFNPEVIDESIIW